MTEKIIFYLKDTFETIEMSINDVKNTLATLPVFPLGPFFQVNPEYPEMEKYHRI